jgi:hypothetical protein
MIFSDFAVRKRVFAVMRLYDRRAAPGPATERVVGGIIFVRDQM